MQLKLQNKKIIEIKCISMDSTEFEHNLNHEWTDYSFFPLVTNKFKGKKTLGHLKNLSVFPLIYKKFN